MVEELFELERKLPRWLRPAYHGAVFILGFGSGWEGKLYVGLIVVMLMVLAGPLAGLKLFLGLALVLMAGGAVAGTLHAWLEPVQTAGALGTWLQWTGSFFGFILAVALATPTGPFSLRDPTFYPVAAGVAALGGLLLVFLDDRRPGRPLPRQYAEQERRRRWFATAGIRRALAAARRDERRGRAERLVIGEVEPQGR